MYFGFKHGALAAFVQRNYPIDFLTSWTFWQQKKATSALYLAWLSNVPVLLVLFRQYADLWPIFRAFLIKWAKLQFKIYYEQSTWFVSNSSNPILFIVQIVCRRWIITNRKASFLTRCRHLCVLNHCYWLSLKLNIRRKSKRKNGPANISHFCMELSMIPFTEIRVLFLFIWRFCENSWTKSTVYAIVIRRHNVVNAWIKYTQIMHCIHFARLDLLIFSCSISHYIL